MSDLKMETHATGDGVHGELVVDPPYDFLVGFIAAEVGHSLDAANEWAGFARQALAGKPIAGCEGNAWCLDANAEVATLRNEYVGPPAHIGVLPTPMLLDVLERWLAFLESSGKGYKLDTLP